MEIETLLLFFSASVILALSPGPDNIFVLLQSAMHGAKSGFIVVLGLCSGLLVHTMLVAFGIAALIAASPLLFMALKFSGALYLLYLAFLSFWQKHSNFENSSVKILSMGALYKRGVIMNLSNPKVILFFLAYLPQFISADKSAAMQSVILGILFIVASLIVFGVIALISGVVGDKLFTSARAQKTVHVIAGVVFTLLALHLLIF